MSEQTLKELLKPPFRNEGSEVFDKKGLIFEIIDLSMETEGEELFDIVTAALNEKWERDFSKPKRWILDKEDGSHTLWICPKCDNSYAIGYSGQHRFLHCPHCGQRLLPPKENI